jgi:hypothetical protein
MIPNEIIINFKTATKEEKEIIRNMLISNYSELVDDIINYAEYGDVVGYWNNGYIPTSGEILTAEEFIKKFKK